MRLVAVVGLGLGLAALPILLTLGIVSESLRSEGDIGALQRSLHPLSLLQAVVPNFFFSLAEPIRYGWSPRLFPESAPYFLSFYLGPLALAAAVERPATSRERLRFALAGTRAARACGTRSAATRASPVFVHPLLHFFRFPVKALLLPCSQRVDSRRSGRDASGRRPRPGGSWPRWRSAAPRSRWRRRGRGRIRRGDRCLARVAAREPARRTWRCCAAMRSWGPGCSRWPCWAWPGRVRRGPARRRATACGS